MAQLCLSVAADIFIILGLAEEEFMLFWCSLSFECYPKLLART